MIYVIATLTVRAEKRADFLENARTVIAATHRDEGCVSFDLHSSITEPNLFVFVERWASREAFQGHMGTPHYAEWRRLSAGYLESRKVEIIHPEMVEEL